jgi:myo-inositol 2-dehydrogenase/D-chiro-inositol 1-dehydrogenase
MPDETNFWFARIRGGLKTPHASAADGHRNLLPTMAMDLSAERRTEVRLPVDIERFTVEQALASFPPRRAVSCELGVTVLTST